ncbi:hypothetical protein V8D89_000628 [Ganoderma adspersum]
MLSLPNELVALILVHLSEGSEIEESSWPLRTSSNGWLPLSQTCRRIHDVAVSTQHLWQRIAVFSKIGGLDTALSRSGDLEIDVIFHQPHVIPSAFMLLTSHAVQLRSLVIIEADHNTLCALQFLFSRPMPALTTCQVHLVHQPIRLPRRSGAMWFTVDSTVLPNLRALQLGMLPLDWNSEAISSLRRLSLRDASPQFFMSCGQFLDILESFTALGHLEIRNTPLFAPPRQCTERVVALPYLRTLILESSHHNEISALLFHLQLSEDIDVEINLDISPPRVLCRRLVTLSRVLPRNPTRLPLLASAASASFAFNHGCVFVECSAPAYAEPGRLRVLLKSGSAAESDQGWHYTPSQAAVHFAGLLQHAPLRALELLFAWPYTGETCAASGMFVYVFLTFSELEELAYSGGANEASDRQLLDVLANGALPRLRMLRLGEWNGELVSSLVEVLQIRANGGLRLSQLDIQVVASGERVSGAALQELYGLVDGDVHVR